MNTSVKTTNNHSILTELAVLYNAIIGIDTEEGIYQCVALHLPRLITAERTSMALFRPANQQLEVIGLNANFTTMKVGAVLSLDNSRAGKALIDCKPYSWVVQEHLSTEDGGALSNAGFISCMNAPLRTSRGVTGTLNVASATQIYSQSDLEILHQIATLIATSVERLLLLQDSVSASARYQNYSKMLEHLNKLGAVLAATTSISQSLKYTADFANRLFAADRVSYCELSPSKKDIRIIALQGVTHDEIGSEIPLNESGLQQIFTQGEFTHFTDLESSPSPVHRALAESGLVHLWSAPILSGETIVAALSFGTPDRNFNVDDVGSVLKTASNLLALTVERIRFHDSNECSLRTLIDDNPTMLVVLNDKGTIEQVSQFGAERLGYQPDQLVNVPFTDIHPIEVRTQIRVKLDKWLQSEQHGVDVSEVLMMHNNKAPRWTRQTARLTDNSQGSQRVLVVCEDIHDVRLLAERMQQQAKTDTLTGLPNRYEFGHRLTQMLALSSRNGTKLSVLFIDIDKFKDINDTLGHQTGDLVLREVAERLRSVLRTSDVIGRIGGDEFLVLLPDCGSENEILTTTRRIVSALNQPMKINSIGLQISGSIGISRFPQDGNTGEELIKHADVAMYRAKESGRNGYRVYSEEFTKQLNRRILLENDLRKAIEEQQLTLVFQPQIDVINERIYAVEALVRWEHPFRGIIGPDEFIPLAESCGLIESLTDWVLDNSIQTLQRLHHTDSSLRVAINISAIEFARGSSLKQRIERALKKHHLLPEFLELEITETALLENPEQATQLVRDFYDMGVRIAIDDFGTGYSSLSYLVHLPISSIKIDRSFVQNINNDRRKQAVVEGLVAISKSIGVGCIAEGVEESSELVFLQAHNCNHIQGYIFSKPLPELALTERLAKSQLNAAASQGLAANMDTGLPKSLITSNGKVA